MTFMGMGVGCESTLGIILFFCLVDVRNTDLTLLITVSPFNVCSPLQPWLVIALFFVYNGRLQQYAHIGLIY